MKSLLFILSTLISFTLFANSYSTSYATNDTTSKNISKKDTIPFKFIIVTSPLNLISPWYGALAAIGAEYRINKQYSFYLEYGSYLATNLIAEPEDNSGYLFKADFKRYFTKHISHDYIDLELLYSEQNYNRTDSIYVPSVVNKVNYTYPVKKNYPGLIILYGIEWIKLKRLYLNFYVGGGVLLNSVTCGLTAAEAASRNLGDWNDPLNWMEKPGTHLITNTCLGFKIGYKIR